MSDGILLFTNDTGGGSAGGNAFDQAAFQDISLPPTNNTGFTSTLARNPMGDYFANDFAPKYAAKELHFRDLQRVQDRALWINGKPTYKIIWSENFPGVDAYAFGNIQIKGTDECRYFVCLDQGDGVSMVGTMVNVAWNLLPVESTSATTCSSAATTDGNSVGTINSKYFYGVTPNGFNGGYFVKKPIYNYQIHSSTNQARNIHNYQISANGQGVIVLQSVLAYFEIPGFGIDCFAGSGFVNKTAVLSTGTSLVYPGVSNLLGGLNSVFVNTAAAFGTTFSPIPSQSSIGIGSNGTNQVAVTTGTGASFPAGTGVYIQAGSSFFLGYVASVSTDTLTLGNTLPFGVSNVISSICAIGGSLPISATLFSQRFSYDLAINHGNINAGFSPNYILGPLVGSSPGINGWTGAAGLLSFSDPSLAYRVTGWSMLFTYGSSFNAGFTSSLNGLQPGVQDTFGLGWGGVTSTLEIAGKFTALDLEFWCGTTATLKATYIIDGFAYGSLNETIAGPAKIKRTILGYAGNGWHQVSFNPAGSTQILLTKVNGYRPNAYNAPAFGNLANISVGQTMIRSVIDVTGQTYTALGNITRLYPDDLAVSSLNANWLLQAAYGTGATATNGGVFLFCPGGADATSTVNVGFFGKGFCISGATAAAPFGTTGVVIANGISSGLSLGQWITFPSATFINLTAWYTSGSAGPAITAIDILQGDQISNVQTFTPIAGISSSISYYNSPTEPANAKPGDVWMQSPENSVAYQQMFGGWQRMNLNQPACLFTVGTTLSYALASGASQSIPYNLAYYDPLGMGSFNKTASASFSIKIPSDGNYILHANVGWVSNGSSSVGLYRILIDTPYNSFVLSERLGASLNGIDVTQSGSVILPNLKKGQILTPYMFQSTGVTQIIDANSRTFFSCQRIG